MGTGSRKLAGGSGVLMRKNGIFALLKRQECCTAMWRSCMKTYRMYCK